MTNDKENLPCEKSKAYTSKQDIKDRHANIERPACCLQNEPACTAPSGGRNRQKSGSSSGLDLSLRKSVFPVGRSAGLRRARPG